MARHAPFLGAVQRLADDLGMLHQISAEFGPEGGTFRIAERKGKARGRRHQRSGKNQHQLHRCLIFSAAARMSSARSQPGEPRGNSPSARRA